MASNATMKRPMVARRSDALTGTIRVPGDKSISHRSLIFGGLTVGRTEVTGLLEAEDVLNTMAAMQALGARIEYRKGRGGMSSEGGSVSIDGVGVGALAEPDRVLDMGNSGTAARLLVGLVATHPITTFFTGDASLVKRPMARVTVPLGQMGANFLTRSGELGTGRLPMSVIGAELPIPIEYRLPVASAQVKSAVLLAGLNTPGETSVIEDVPTRDHTENMLKHFGIPASITELDDGASKITVTGQQELVPAAIQVPSDPSSAAFPLVAALLRPGSDVTIEAVGMNERRTGLFITLQEMGADITILNERVEAGEPVADLRVRYSKLEGIEVPAERAASMIDEYPVLMAAASCAKGTTYMPGLHELRVKESDRLAMMAKGLAACGVDLTEGEEDLTIRGTGEPPRGGAEVETALDHRIAMSFLILGQSTAEPVTVDDASPIATSFPNFTSLMEGLGAKLQRAPI
ncbi:MAG: 3-phosphoshikimate 1-carboxyvinyltransferase [Alphaproteobacteria bacterium]|nr:3-phosphoshikimate 1-carboxyvinyltransferase [Alphaproteobacteria bacterium SS10]